AKIVTVLRGKSVLLARPETILQPGDRLLLIATARAQEALAQHFAPPPALNSATGTTGAS
ncbi:MAG: TrkA C-terminal domain-containing protein, partial [Candidatus Sulfotelmatobacter sp.]